MYKMYQLITEATVYIQLEILQYLIHKFPYLRFIVQKSKIIASEHTNMFGGGV